MFAFLRLLTELESILVACEEVAELTGRTIQLNHIDSIGPGRLFCVLYIALLAQTTPFERGAWPN